MTPAAVHLPGPDTRRPVYRPSGIDLPLAAAGAFRMPDGTRSLEGRFCGPAHRDTGGVFRHAGHRTIGAFGTTREPQ